MMAAGMMAAGMMAAGTMAAGTMAAGTIGRQPNNLASRAMPSARSSSARA